MLDKKSEMRLSILGLRGAFGGVLQAYLESSQKSYKVITADTSSSAGLSRFKATFPENFIECGISEQSATAIASSISLEGQNVYLGSFSPFIICQFIGTLPRYFGRYDPCRLIAPYLAFSKSAVGNRCL